MTNQSNTEQMREALRKIKHEAVSLADAQVIALEALTAPAAEVPEAMGDERICELWSWSATSEAERTATTQQHAFARAIIAARDAQWQSTRLRGGVPERAALTALFKDAMDWGRSYGQRLNLSDITLADVSEGYADKALREIYAAPQDPAAEMDAGVVRNAERWRKFVSLDYKVRREWAANLSLTPVLTEWVDALPATDAAMSAKGGE